MIVGEFMAVERDMLFEKMKAPFKFKSGESLVTQEDMIDALQVWNVREGLLILGKEKKDGSRSVRQVTKLDEEKGEIETMRFNFTPGKGLQPTDRERLRLKDIISMIQDGSGSFTAIVTSEGTE